MGQQFRTPAGSPQEQVGKHKTDDHDDDHRREYEQYALTLPEVDIYHVQWHAEPLRYGEALDVTDGDAELAAGIVLEHGDVVGTCDVHLLLELGGIIVARRREGLEPGRGGSGTVHNGLAHALDELDVVGCGVVQRDIGTHDN